VKMTGGLLLLQLSRARRTSWQQAASHSLHGGQDTINSDTPTQRCRYTD